MRVPFCFDSGRPHGTAGRGVLLVSAAFTALAAAPLSSAEVTPRLRAALASSRPADTHVLWVYFRDKGPADAARTTPLTPRALSRRALRGTLGPGSEQEDRPLYRPYLDGIAGRVLRVRHESRWLNGVSVEATGEQIHALEALPFVERLDAVRRLRRPPDEPAAKAASREDSPRQDGGLELDYGLSLGQVQQINVPAVHNQGLHGEGMVIALFDTGFNNLAHETFTSMAILARHDFVNGDDDVGDGLDRGQGSHGTMTLSVIGGFKPGQLVGPAFGASFILAKTEDTDRETPVEEDHWAAAAEWAEGMGVDVVSSSLGYLDYDAPFPSHTFADMNGETAVCTKAAALAAERGVVVVNSAGNSGFNPDHNTLGAPADGKRVVSVGAVDFLGDRVSFSSVGPTVDGRIKPDVAAQGSGVRAASSASVDGYSYVSGTSFSCPLTAGVVALILQAHPTYTVDQVLFVLRSTASRAATPDNLLGWGIVNAAAAVQAQPPPAPSQQVVKWRPARSR